MSIQRQKKELSIEMEALEQHLSMLESNVRLIQDRLDVSNRELVRLSEARDLKNKDRMMIQMETDQIEKELSRESNISEALKSEIGLLVNEREAVFARSEQFSQQLQQETLKREECEAQFQEGETQLEIKRREQADLQTQVHDSRIQIAELKERDRAAIAEIDRLKQQLENVQKAIADNVQIVRQREQEIVDTEVVCKTLEEQQVEMLRRRDEQKQSIVTQESQKEQLGNEITSQDSGVQEARSILFTVRQERTST
jgi:chromosome segregation ATPase